ncbi:MAG: GrdX family protein [Tissierellia bacterium]|nr:GrdX family protein [Tissierellia bacterium]
MLLTNNWRFKELKNIDILYEKKSSLDILIHARDLVHLGYKLMTHPLYANLKPREMLYRSIYLVKTNSMDLESVMLIEEAISKLQMANFKRREYNQSVKDDFSYIDFEIVKDALRQGGIDV